MKHSLKYLVLSRFVFIITSVIIIMAVYTVIGIHAILEQTLESRSKDDFQLLSYYMEDFSKSAETTSKIFALDDNVNYLLTHDFSSAGTEKLSSVYQILSKIEKNVFLHDYIASFCIISADKNLCYRNKTYDNKYISWFEENALKGKSISSFQGYTDAYIYPITVHNSSQMRLVSYVVPLKDVTESQPETIGYLILSLDFDQLIRNIRQTDTIFDDFSILNSSGTPLYSNARTQAAFPDQILEVNDTHPITQTAGGELFISQKLPSTDWFLSASVDKSAAYSFLQDSYIFAGGILIILVILCIYIFLYPLLKRITGQIRLLNNALDQVKQGNYQIKTALDGSSELKNISDGFNLMTVSIQEHIQETLREKEYSSQLSFELLLAKINPHFIYNTLNSIIYLARKDKCQDIIEMTSAFIYLLQDSIHLGHSPIYAKCENEVEVIRQYITIQSYRYKGLFSFHMYFDEELKASYIPRNILQPIIENSLIHGICTDDKPGDIYLSLKRKERFTEIIIKDTGAGMEQAYADKLLHSKAAEESSRRSKVRPIGIQNIAERLDFLFPENHVFSIKSQPGEGTEILIQVPYIEKLNKTEQSLF